MSNFYKDNKSLSERIWRYGDIYNKDIKEIQMGYRHYQKLIAEFKEVNVLFNSIAKDFDIDISKWYN